MIWAYTDPQITWHIVGLCLYIWYGHTLIHRSCDIVGLCLYMWYGHTLIHRSRDI